MRVVWIVVPMVCLLAGCGDGPRYKIIPVEGKITFVDGKPLPAGTRVVLNPSEGGVGTASGVTREDGTFALTHARGGRGAEIGKYTVQVLAPEKEPGDFYQVV